MIVVEAKEFAIRTLFERENKYRAMIKARKEKEKEQSFETEKAVCPEAVAANLVHDYGASRARVWGTSRTCPLMADFVDGSPEWRAFDHDQRMKRSRVGAPMTYTIHDKGLFHND